MKNLSGPLEKKLRYLDLSRNMLSGSIPDFSSFWFLNRLALGGNVLNGSIAEGYLNIPYLTHLDLSSNNITSGVPDFVSSSFIEKIYLNDNMFNGHLSESIGGLSELEVLRLGSNQLQGIVTESHLLNLSRLQIFDLSANLMLTLNLSIHWVPPFQLIAMSLSQCKIGPYFPNWLQVQTQLVFLDISFTQIVDTIPSWFGNLASKLSYLNASSNQLHGLFPHIPTFDLKLGIKIKSPFNQNMLLRKFDLSGNQIRGAIPKCVRGLSAMIETPGYSQFNQLRGLAIPNGNFLAQFSVLDGAYFMWKGLEVNYVNNVGLVNLIDISNNELLGYIPSEIVELVGLIGLNLSRNNLIGSIPRDIGKMKSLNFLDVSRNKLWGKIPTSLSELSRLRVLNLSYNNLWGEIPRSSHMLTFDELSYTGNPGLCGRPLPLERSCTWDRQDPKLTADNNTMKYPKDDDQFITPGFYMSMGLGFVFGFWGVIFGTILLNKSIRY
ncbi:receptor-like protein EIX2 [Henckelia pumila]|uniref:receptor-like protein EIX2 n=1 Tax=Henckelia pumila TaxID=405737 RepID=UPI003C6E9A17